MLCTYLVTTLDAYQFSEGANSKIHPLKPVIQNI